MMKLYVIGNGFDLWHGLPTKYEHFYASAKDVLDEHEEFYSFDLTQQQPWYDFENALGYFDWSHFYATHNNVDVASESFRPSEAYALEDDLNEQSDHHVQAIRDSFQTWIGEIDVSIAQRKLVFFEDAIFVNFNYTSTLQAVYAISDEKVLHVHGCADHFDELIFGHGRTMEEEAELDENGDSSRTMFSDAEGAAKYPFYALQKPVNKVIEENRRFFGSTRCVTEIIVIGHSLNEIDLPYFAELARCTPSAKWLVCYFEPADEIHHVNQLVRCGVRHENIQMCTYAHLLKN